MYKTTFSMPRMSRSRVSTVLRSFGVHALHGKCSTHTCCRLLFLRCGEVQRCSLTGRCTSGVLDRGLSSVVYRTYRLGLLLSCCLRAKQFSRTCRHTRPLVGGRIAYCRTGLETFLGLTCCTRGTKGPRVTSSVYTHTRRTLTKQRGSRCLLLCVKRFVVCGFVIGPRHN